MKKLITGIVFLFLFAPAVSATCLSIDDIIVLQTIESNNNITNNTLIHIFEGMCARSYEKAQTDMLLNLSNAKVDLQVEYIESMLDSVNFNQIDSRIDDYMNNYTEWFEREIELKKLLLVINSNTNKTGDEKYATMDYVNDELSGVKNWVEREMEDINMTFIHPADAASSQQDLSWVGILIICIIVAVFIMFQFGLIKIPERISYGKQPENVYQSENSPDMGFKSVSEDMSQHDDLETARDKQLAVWEANRKFELRKKEIGTAKNEEEMQKIKKGWTERDKSEAD